MGALRNNGVQSALLAAILFGLGTPLAKLLLDADAQPWVISGILYTGSGVGLFLVRLLTRAQRIRIDRASPLPLFGAVTFGGAIAPALLMYGLHGMPASGASLLLNLEGVATALIAWFVFRENFDRRIALGMVAVVAGAAVLSFDGSAQFGQAGPALAVVGACVCWGIDNNLTRRIALTDATWLAAVKGAVAGPVNLGLALLVGASLPSLPITLGAAAIGFFAYGVSLVLFIVALRGLGAARTGAYFAVAPFFGALLAICLGDRVTWALAAAGALMALGVWLHLTERHDHPHVHSELTHEHWHVHDDHHQHDHADDAHPWDEHDRNAASGPVTVTGTIGSRPRWHSHEHHHEAISHQHEHYPDAHHQHSH